MIFTGKSTKNQKMEGRLLIKIIFNHFSYLTIISLFDLDWKDPVMTFFDYIKNYTNSSPQSIFNLDCVFDTDPETKFKIIQELIDECFMEMRNNFENNKIFER